MTFAIPPNFDQHLDRTKRAIEALIQRQVITSFDSSDLKIWLKNFETDLDRYLASQLLDFLVVRSNKMLTSMCQNAVEHTIMAVLRERGIWVNGEYDKTIKRISDGDKTLPFRFVVIEDFGEDPAKSGSEVFRHYKRAKAIHKSLAIQAKRISTQPDHVKLLILLDDFSGTGKQVCTFSREHKLETHASKFEYVFLPLMAHKDAHVKITQKAPYLKFNPVETLSNKHNFFCENAEKRGIWLRDNFNHVDDVKKYYYNFLKKKGIYICSEYNLNLAVGFDISTPNNTLNIFWATKNGWNPLLQR